MKLSVGAAEIVISLIRSVAASSVCTRGPWREAKDALQAVIVESGVDITADEKAVFEAMIKLLEHNLEERSVPAPKTSLLGTLAKAEDPAVVRRSPRKRHEVDL